MMKLFKIAFLPLLAGILLLPAASRPVRAAGSAAVEAGAGDRKRDKKKKQEADTAAKATPYEKLFKDKRVETVRGGGLTLHLTADKLYLELPDSLLGRGLMITTTIEWTGDPGDGLAHQQPVPPYMVEFGRGKSDTLLCMREFAPVVIVAHRVLFYPSHFFTFCQNFCFCLKCLICFYTLDDGRLFCAFNAFNSSNTTSFRTLM